MCWWIYPDYTRTDVWWTICSGDVIKYDGCCNGELCRPETCVVDYVEMNKKGDRIIVCKDGRRVLEYCVCEIW